MLFIEKKFCKSFSLLKGPALKSQGKSQCNMQLLAGATTLKQNNHWGHISFLQKCLPTSLYVQKVIIRMTIILEELRHA
jgi:hypothetical protein